MSCCSGKSLNDNCGNSTSTVTIPQNAIASPVVCRLPCVREFSTSIARFQNQIVRNVLIALSQRCEALTPPPVPLPPGTLILLSDTTTFNQSLAATVTLDIEATAINSVNVTLQNVLFEIIGFASVIVRVSGDAVINVSYQGIDALTHTQTAVIPFAFTETIAGNFPPNVVVQGSLSVNSQLVVNDVDPSTLAIAAVSITLFFATNIRILLPVV